MQETQTQSKSTSLPPPSISEPLLSKAHLQTIDKILQQMQGKDMKEVDFEMGIDQAGRGPVFGSMIYSGLWWPIQLRESLSSLGFCDSKTLPEYKRQQLYQCLEILKNKVVFFETCQITAAEISASMQSVEYHSNLNQISHRAALSLCLKAFDTGHLIRNVYVDTVGDSGKYKIYLLDGLASYKNVLREVIVQPKADRDHKVVSASSICAKVQRDRILSKWKFIENIEFNGPLGSGYPGDPATRQWLDRNYHPIWGYPNLVRFSWSTVSNIFDEKKIPFTPLKHRQCMQLNNLSYLSEEKLNTELQRLIPN